MSAEVLHLPSRPDGQAFYHSSALPSHPIRRPSPSTSFLLDKSALPSSNARTSSSPKEQSQHQEWLPATPPPSTTLSILSPDIATATSRHRNSEPTADRKPTLETEISLPDYLSARLENQTGSISTPPGSPTFNDDSSDEPTDASATTDTTRSSSPLLTPTVVDDTAVKQLPSRQVDFLSHDWREEDIWSSWRHIVSQRKSTYGEKSRLENASWRTWAKSKYRLPTVSPEKLNWLKESDVTWLYGPLKPASSYPITQRISEPCSQLSKSNSFIAKKPILKKRSASEVMLQKSISTSSLLKQAAASVQAQGQSNRKSTSQGCDVVDSKFGSETPSRDQFDYFTSRSTSNCDTPCHEKRHIRFDDRVEQCIAVDCKDPGADFGEESDGEDDHHADNGSDSGSDEGIVMKPSRRRTIKQRRPSNGSRSNSHTRTKTIETLPATTLKYRTDSPDIPEDAPNHTFSRSWSTGKLSPSASQETLRPSHPSSNFLVSEEDDDEDIDSDSSWSFGASNPKSSLGASSRGSRNRSSTPGPRDNDFPIEGMRRTGSGMFMPYDDDENDLAAQGIFGRVSETINTARDIAHVIWNVGWRK